MNNKEKCSRLESLKEELLNDWDMLNLQAKSLILLVFFVLIGTILITCLPNFPKNIAVLFRSTLSSIFGFFLSSKVKSEDNILNKVRSNEYCNKDIKKYNFKEGNMIQIIIAIFISIVSMLSIFVLYGFGISNCSDTLSYLMNLMCLAIGFLLGEAKIKKL